MDFQRGRQFLVPCQGVTQNEEALFRVVCVRPKNTKVEYLCCRFLSSRLKLLVDWWRMKIDEEV